MAKTKIILCDSNILIDAFKEMKDVIEDLKNAGKENIAVSSVSVAEMLYGALNKNELNELQRYFQFIRVIPVNEHINDIFLRLMTMYSLSHRPGIPDMLIAATALYHGFELFTLNTKHFNYIKGLKLYNP